MHTLRSPHRCGKGFQFGKGPGKVGHLERSLMSFDRFDPPLQDDKPSSFKSGKLSLKPCSTKPIGDLQILTRWWQLRRLRHCFFSADSMVHERKILDSSSTTTECALWSGTARDQVENVQRLCPTAPGIIPRTRTPEKGKHVKPSTTLETDFSHFGAYNRAFETRPVVDVQSVRHF